MSFGHLDTAWRNHVCGLHYTAPNAYQMEKSYLPQVELQAHTSILSAISRTTLTQTFVNPSDIKGIKKVTYTLPLYDGVSVVGFTCHVGKRTIVGEVKEKEKARAVFQEAVARGETAGLFEQLPDAADCFTTTVGNVPPSAKVVIQITYLGELKHDMEVDGIRFTIPNIICPRYGVYPSGIVENSATGAQGNGISITIDAEMPDGCFIQQIRSPSHPIAVNMGTTSVAPNAEPKMNQASATLSLGSTQLDTDFVLQIISKDIGVPKAVLETHPTIPNHRALMATLVPKFSLPAEKPEIVFVCDRSGSMAGSRIKLVVNALKIFLKSLPVGIKFNICSFGSAHSFLWPKSVTYNQQNLDQAIKHVEEFDGNYGGTEMLPPLKATIQQRYKDIPLEVMFLTDGEIWQPDALFKYLNKEVTDTKAPIRIFTLGIGNGVSHSLIEGVARAGNGFAQAVGEGEKMDSKVVRMLKGALSPHVNDYTLEVKYSDKMTETEVEDDFEIIEAVADSLRVKLNLGGEEKKEAPKKPISLFDQSINLDKEGLPVHDETGESRYSHLPKLAVPKIIQAPQNIPSLFAFNRTTVYLLLGPDAPQETPKSIILRGTSVHGPLELEIPVQILENPGETVHQLAAKKGIAELEQGRGWLPAAKDESGKPIKEVFESRFEDMVEREAVRLGIQFHVGGKWCSFVAVEKQKCVDDIEMADHAWLDDADPSTHGSASDITKSYGESHKRPNPYVPFPAAPARGLFGDSSYDPSRTTLQNYPAQSLFGSQQHTGFSTPPGRSVIQSQATGYQASTYLRAPHAPSMGSPPMHRLQSQQQQQQQQQHASQNAQPQAQQQSQQPQGNHALQDYQMQLMLLEQQNKKRLLMARQEQDVMSAPSSASPTAPFGTASTALPPPPPPPPLRRNVGNVNPGIGSTPAPAPAPPPFNRDDAGDFGSALESFDFDSFLHVREEDSFGAGSALESFDFDSFLHVGGEDSTGVEGSNGDSGLGAGPESASAFGSVMPIVSAPSSGLFENSEAPSINIPTSSTATAFGSTVSSGSPFGNSGVPSTATGSAFGSASPFRSRAQVVPKTDDERLDALVGLQTFEGFWEWNEKLFSAVDVSELEAEKEMMDSAIDKRTFATALAVAFLEEKLGKLRGSWELVAMKARGWLGANGNAVDLTKGVLGKK